MAAVKPSPQDITHAYRHLYRGILHAVQYSMPSRFTARDQLRAAFRKGDPSTFDQEKINRTVEFLNIAARETGLEHRLVKNLIHTAYWRRQRLETRRAGLKKTPTQEHFYETAMIHYDMTVAMLNDSMGLCLR